MKMNHLAGGGGVFSDNAALPFAFDVVDEGLALFVLLGKAELLLDGAAGTVSDILGLPATMALAITRNLPVL